MRIEGRRVIAWTLLLVMGLMMPLGTGAEEQTYLSSPISLEDVLADQAEQTEVPEPPEENPQEEEPPVEGFAPLQDTYMVTFLLEGEAYSDQEVDRDTLASPPTDPIDPTGQGRHFIGWYEPGAETPFDFYTLIHRNLTLETRFSERFLVIFRDSEAGKREILQVETVTDGESVSVPELSVECPVGRRFSHWFIEGTENPGLHPYNFASPVEKNLTLLPYLTDISMVVFVAEGMDTVTQRLEPGEQATAIEPPKLDGHIFQYWAQADGTAYDFASPVHGLVTLQAHWETEPTVFQLVYWVEKAGVKEAGEDLSQYEHVYAVPAEELLPEHQRPTGSLLSYGDMKSLADAYMESAVAASENSPLPYAQFAFGRAEALSGDGKTLVNLYYQRSAYTLRFDLGTRRDDTFIEQGGRKYVGNEYAFTAKVGQSLKDLWPTQVTHPSKSWYGWEVSGQALYTAPDVLAGDMVTGNGTRTLWASPLWQESDGDVEHVFYFSALPGEEQKTDLGSIPEWNAIADAQEAPAAVRFEGSIYLRMDEMTIHGEGMEAEAWEARISAWIGDGAEELLPGRQERVSTDGTQTRVFHLVQRQPVTLALHPMHDGVMAQGEETLSLLRGEAIPAELPEPQPMEGYLFAGWYLDPDFREPVPSGMRMPAVTTTLYAKYEGTAYQVRFWDVEGRKTSMQVDLPNPQPVPRGSAAVLPESYQKGVLVEGYGVFLGWYFDNGGVMVEFTDRIGIYHDYEVYAQWEPVQYTIRYFEDGDARREGKEPYATRQVTSGLQNTIARSLQYPPDAPPARAGQRFGGWYLQPDGSGSRFTAATPVLSDVDVYGVWEEVTYRVTYQLAGIDAAYLEQTAVYGQRMPVADPPGWAGYQFSGWQAQEESPQLTGDTFSMPDHDVLLRGEMLKRFAVRIEWDYTGAPVENRPQEAEVLLSRAGETYDQKTLESTGGSHVFLVPYVDVAGHGTDFVLLAEEVPGYQALRTQDGDTTVFTYVYQPESLSLAMEGQLILLGDEGAAEETFRFEMEARDREFPMPGGMQEDVAVASVPAEGEFTFGEMRFDEPGTYTYTIRQREGENEAYTYDGAVYQVTVRVLDRQGVLVPSISYQKTAGQESTQEASLAFVNQYRTPREDLEIRITWDDGNNERKVRRSFAQAQLYRTPEGGLEEEVGGPVRISGLTNENTWQYTFAQMPQHDTAGAAYTYRVALIEADPNYTAAYEDMHITQTFTPVTLTLTKEWNILGTGFRKPVEGIYVELYRADDPSEPVGSYTVLGAEQEDVWTQEAPGLLGYRTDGTPIEYILREPEAAFATTKEEAGLTVTNTYPQDETLAVRIVFEGEGLPQSLIPEQVQVDLIRDGADPSYATAVVRADTDWRHVFQVPKVHALQSAFTIEQEALEFFAQSYAQEADGSWTVRNVFQNPLTEISGTVSWRDVPPVETVPAVKLLLWRGETSSEPYRTLAVQAGETSFRFEGLPVYAPDGTLYSYHVSQDPVPGYRLVTSESYQFENIYRAASVTAEILGEKAVQGEDAPPIDFVFRLTAGDTRTPMPENSRDGWREISTRAGAFSLGTIAYDEPGLYAYTLAEVGPLPEGFTGELQAVKLMVEVTESNAGMQARVITETPLRFESHYTPVLRDVTVGVDWEDQLDAQGVRPASLRVQLTRGTQTGLEEDVPGQRVTLGAEGDWTHTFEQMPYYDAQGEVYRYSLRPLNPPAQYRIETRETRLAASLKTRSVQGEMLWQLQEESGKAPPVSGVRVELYRQDAAEPIGEQWVTGDTETDRWSFVFDNLLEVDAQGEPYLYTVKQEPVEGFATTVSDTTLLNVELERAIIAVRVEWTPEEIPQEALPGQVEVTLLRQGDDETPLQTLTLQGPQWAGSFQVPREELESVLRVDQAEQTHFLSRGNWEGEDRYVVVYEYTGQTVTISGNQRWEGVPEAFLTPAVIVDLYRQGEDVPVRSQVLSAGETAYHFAQVPRTNERGEAYPYQVQTRPVSGFDTRMEGDEIVHRYLDQGAGLSLVGYLEYTGDGAPEETLTYTLTAADANHPMPEGSQGAVKSIQTDTGILDFGEIAFSHPGYYYYTVKQQAGQRRDVTYDTSDIQLTVTVTDLPGQGNLAASVVFHVAGQPVDELRFTNSYQAPRVDWVAQVWWEDQEDAWATRPQSLALQLTRALEGEVSQDVPEDQGGLLELEASGDWRHVVKDLPAQNAKGQAYQYGLRLAQEYPAYEMSSTPNGWVLTLRTVEISGQVAWDIQGSGFVLPDEGVEILLMQGGQEAPIQREWILEETTDNPWSFRFAQVPAVDARGEAYTYRIEQAQAPLGCLAVVSGTTVTNHYAVDPQIEIALHWRGDDAQQPGQVRATLRQGEENQTVDTVELTAREDWRHVFVLPLSEYLGQEYQWSIEVPEGYQVTYRVEEDVWVADLSYAAEPVSISGQIHWVGVPEGESPPALRISLWRRGDEQAPLRSLMVQPGEDAYTFADLPRLDADGSPYTYWVTQHAPVGYTVIQKDNDFLNTYAPTGVSYRLLGEWVMLGQTPGVEQEFAFELTAQDAACPMPEDTLEGRKVIRATPGALDFGEIRYTTPGIFRYQIRALPGGAEEIRLDETVFDVQVTVIYDEGLKLSLRIEKAGNLATGISFTHAYAAPSRSYAVWAQWQDEDDRLGLRPERVVLRLIRQDATGGQVEVTDVEGGWIELTGENGWRQTFTDLAAVDVQGMPYTYRVRLEEESDSYQVEQTDGQLTFTVKPAQVRAELSASTRPLSPDVVPVVDPGEVLWYTLTLENETTRPVYQTRVMHILPAGVTVLPEACTPPADAAFAQEDGSTVLMWSLSEIPAAQVTPGRAQIRIPAQVTALAEGEASRLMESQAFYRLAEAAEEPFPWQADAPDDSSAYTAVEPVRHQLVSLTQDAQPQGGTEDSPAYLQEGQALSYTVVLHVAAPAAGVTVSATVPEALTLVQESLATDLERVTVAPYYEASQRRVVFPDLHVPEGGATLRFDVVTAKFSQGDVLEGRLEQTVEMASEADFADAPLWRAQSTKSLHTLIRRQVDVELQATLVTDRGEGAVENGSEASPVAAALGQRVGYRLTVRSRGYLAQGAVRVEATLEEGVTFLPDAWQIEPAEATDRVHLIEQPTADNEYRAVWRIDQMAKDETVTLTFQVAAPETTDRAQTGERETRRVWSVQAQAVDEGLRNLTYADHPESAVYTDGAETTALSRTAYHVVNEPALQVAVRGAPESPLGNGDVWVLESGDIVTYTIDVANVGHAAATGVRIMDLLPQGMEYVNGSATGNAQVGMYQQEGRWVLFWQIARLDAADPQSGNITGREQLQFQARVLEPTQAALLENQVYYRLARTEDGVFPPSVPDGLSDYEKAIAESHHQVFTFHAEDSADGGRLEKTARQVAPGDALTYELVLSAADVIRNVQVRDQIPEGMTLAVGSIHILQPDGEQILISDEALDAQSGQLQFPALDVVAGETRFVFTLVVERPAEGKKDLSYRNQAQVTLDQGGGIPLRAQANDLYHKAHIGWTTITQKSRLYDDGTPRISDQGTPESPARAQRGQEIGYEFTVVRSGSEEIRSGDIIITDVLPAGTTLLPDTIQGTYNGYVGKLVSMREIEVVEPDGTARQAVEWVLSGMMEEESASLSVRALLPTAIDDPQTPETETKRVVINQALLTDQDLADCVYQAAVQGKAEGTPLYPQQDQPVSNTAYHQILAPSIQVELTADREAGTAVQPGDTVTYHITLTNRGEDTARSLLVRDPVPMGAKYVTQSSTSDKQDTIIGAAMQQGRTYLTWVVQKLGAGESVTLSFQVQVLEAPDTSGVMENVAQYSELVEGLASDVIMQEEGFQDTNPLVHVR